VAKQQRGDCSGPGGGGAGVEGPSRAEMREGWRAAGREAKVRESAHSTGGRACAVALRAALLPAAARGIRTFAQLRRRVEVHVA